MKRVIFKTIVETVEYFEAVMTEKELELLKEVDDYSHVGVCSAAISFENKICDAEYTDQSEFLDARYDGIDRVEDIDE